MIDVFWSVASASTLLASSTNATANATPPITVFVFKRIAPFLQIRLSHSTARLITVPQRARSGRPGGGADLAQHVDQPMPGGLTDGCDRLRTDWSDRAPLCHRSTRRGQGPHPHAPR